MDHAAIRRMICEHFEADVVSAHGVHDALERLARQPFDLVLVNRLIPGEAMDGVGFIRAIKADGRFRGLPVMLLSNYAEYQRRAVAAGAEAGFGKAELDHPSLADRLAPFLRGDDLPASPGVDEHNGRSACAVQAALPGGSLPQR